ncbi:MAG: hypothetical protein WCK98_07185 [bacterium]
MQKLGIISKFNSLILGLVLVVSLVCSSSVYASAQVTPGKDTPPDQKKATPGIKLNQSASANSSTAVSSAQVTSSAATSQQQSVDPAIAIAGSPTVRTGGAEFFAVFGIVILGGSLYYYQKKLKPLKNGLKTKEVKIRSK